MDAVVEAFGFEGEVIVSFHTQTVSAVIFTVDKSLSSVQESRNSFLRNSKKEFPDCS